MLSCFKDTEVCQTACIGSGADGFLNIIGARFKHDDVFLEP